MKNIFKTLLVFSLALFTTIGCQNASDAVKPQITDFRVNDITSSPGRYDHDLGSNLKFTMNVSDNKGLDEMQITANGDLKATIEDIEGTADAIQYDFTVDSDIYNREDTIQIEFKLIDVSGNLTPLPYIIVAQ